MTANDIAARVRALLHEALLDIDAAGLADNADLQRDLGVDSIDLIDIGTRLARSFDIPFSVPAWFGHGDEKNDLTVGSLVAEVQRLCAERRR